MTLEERLTLTLYLKFPEVVDIHRRLQDDSIVISHQALCCM